jgi:hypothetical protein
MLMVSHPSFTRKETELSHGEKRILSSQFTQLTSAMMYCRWLFYQIITLRMLTFSTCAYFKLKFAPNWKKVMCTNKLTANLTANLDTQRKDLFLPSRVWRWYADL